MTLIITLIVVAFIIGLVLGHESAADKWAGNADSLGPIDYKGNKYSVKYNQRKW